MRASFARAAAVCAVGACALAAAPLRAQQPRRNWEPSGFDFSPDGVWRARARRIAALREQALARGDFAMLNSAIAMTRGAPSAFALRWSAGASSAVTGVLRVPALLVTFKNNPGGTPRDTAAYDSVLFGQVPPYGRPYTVRTFYDEMSHGLMSVQGIVIGWIQLDSTQAWYAGSGTCDGLGSCGHVAQLIHEAVAYADTARHVDWTQFDNDGPDGSPNSGDDDGQVDLVWLIQPQIGAECGVDGHIWAHRYYYSAWTGHPDTTSSIGQSGQRILVDNYTIQSGVGGPLCDSTQIMAPGTIGHETGHGLGLPDFYDTNPNDADNSEGIGEWGLMGSGNWARPLSPAHMEAFSLFQLGWIATQQLSTSGTYSFGPIETSDSAFVVRPASGVSNPRGEFFMLENRQAISSDSADIHKGKAPGLLIWHVDSLQYVQCALPNNCVNTGPIHGLNLMQADGLDNLGSSISGVSNRGDGGDPYPGTTSNTVFGYGTTPGATMNTAGHAFAGFVVDSIRQTVPGGEVAFRIRFGGLTVVKASDTSAAIKVHGTAYHLFQDLLGAADTATIAMDSAESGNGGRSQYLFASWSDGGARSHVITGTLSGATLTASVTAQHQLMATTSGSGSVAAVPNVDVATGVYFAAGTAVTLTATPGPGQGFAGWTGDTTASSTSLTLHMQRPYTLTATFASLLVAVDTAVGSPVMGAAFTDTLRVSGSTGIYSFALLSGALPPGLALSVSGVISGIPSKDSTFASVVRVRSGAQTLDVPLRITVSAPSLALGDVVSQVLQGSSSLTSDQVRYLDLNGNQNGQLDIGDLVAWLDKTGASASPGVLNRVLRSHP